jgi:hypothetical protein
MSNKYIDSFNENMKMLINNSEIVRENQELKKINELLLKKIGSQNVIVQTEKEKKLQEKLDKVVDLDGNTHLLQVCGSYISRYGHHGENNYFDLICGKYKFTNYLINIVKESDINAYMIPEFNQYRHENSGSSYSVKFTLHLKSTILLKYPFISHLLDEFKPMNFGTKTRDSNGYNEKIIGNKEMNEKYKHFLFFNPKKLVTSGNDITQLFDMKEQLTLHKFILLSTNKNNIT